MQKKIRYLFLPISFFLIYTTGKAQGLDSLLSKQRTAYPQEKAYVHFDKSYYNPGETIWFKAYLFAGFEPSTVSKNFYSELVDNNGRVISKYVSPILEAGAAGSFDLPSNFSGTTVFFRGYTFAMLQGDTTLLFTKSIKIITSATAVKIKNIPLSTIKFLPEGGDWFVGLPATIAFKTLDGLGNPTRATGVIKSSDGVKVADFTTQHDGMGTCNLEAKPGLTYKAEWKDAQNKTYTNPLPSPASQGISLQLVEVATGKKFTIRRTEAIADENKNLTIVGLMNQQLVFSANIDLTSKKIAIGTLPTTEIPTGILQLTVFNSKNKPLAERVCFVNNHDYELDADAFLPQINKAKRGLNVGEVLQSDTVRSNFSLSITDAEVNLPPTAYEDNIVSRILLTADLHGTIFNPYYYFFNTNDSATAYLDLVMLTNGWRRYNWEKIFSPISNTTNGKESNYLSINGQLANATPGFLAPGTELVGFLRLKDSSSNFVKLPINKKGKVFTDGLIFYDNAKLYFQFNDKKLFFDRSMLVVDNGLLKGYNFIAIDSVLQSLNMVLDTATITKNLRINVEAAKAAAQRYKDEHTLQNVIVKGKTKSELQKLDEKYAGGLFSGGDAKTFDVISDPFATGKLSVFDYLQGQVAGLQITTGGGADPQLSWRGGTPVFYLNETTTDVQQIVNIPMTDVAYIKVYSPGTVGVISSSGGGAIAIYTKKGSDVVNTDVKGLDYVQLNGYTPIKEFYNPDYANTATLANYNDVRTTLYWNPFIILDKKAKRFKFQFYNNDFTRKFRIVLEGINKDGKLFHVEKVLE